MRANVTLVGLALDHRPFRPPRTLGRLRIQAGPLITIICGFVIAAVGFFWHFHTARTEKAASRGVIPSSISESSDVQPSPKKEETAGENIAARDPVVKPTIDPKPSLKQNQDVERSSSPVAERSTPAQVGPSDAEFKSSALAFASKIRVFEQSFDLRRDQIFDKQVGNQAGRNDQMQELKAIEREKANEFTQAFLPQAQVHGR